MEDKSERAYSFIKVRRGSVNQRPEKESREEKKGEESEGEVGLIHPCPGALGQLRLMMVLFPPSNAPSWPHRNERKA